MLANSNHLLWTAHTCSFLAIILLISASFLPLFVVTTLEGQAKISPFIKIDVDIRIGSGIFRRNSCHGDSSHPSESVLAKFGLTCTNMKQLKGCSDYDVLPRHQQDHCDDVRMLQLLEYTAFATALLSTLCITLNNAGGWFSSVKVVLGGFSVLLALVALTVSAVVVQKVQHTDMVDFDIEKSHGWDCAMVLGAEMCHGYGASFYLQIAATVALAVVFVLSAILLCIPYINTPPLLETRVALLGGGSAGT